MIKCAITQCIVALLLLNACSVQVQSGDSHDSQIKSSTVNPINRWIPIPMSSFQIQFNGEINFEIDTEVFELDTFDTSNDVINRLHQSGKKVICYINAGALENWRSDAAEFPKLIIGKAYQGWPGEFWLDISQLELIKPILKARIEMCAEKGFDAVEFDNVDGFQNDTGFQLTADDQLLFNRWLAERAHANNLAAGLKNDPDQMRELEPWFDFAIMESCFDQGWCETALPFIEKGKAVFAIEYTPIEEFCIKASELTISLIQKHRELDSWVRNCSATD